MEPGQCRSTANDEPHDGYRPIAIVGVMMGDSCSHSGNGSTTPAHQRLECSGVTHCCYLNGHCRKDQSSVMCFLMTECSFNFAFFPSERT